MQQYFDEFVFNLKNSSTKYLVPRKLNLEERLKLVTKYKDKDDLPFCNWYSDYSALPYEQAVNIVSQQHLFDSIGLIEGKLKSKKKIWDEIEELQVEIFVYRKSSADIILLNFYKKINILRW